MVLDYSYVVQESDTISTAVETMKNFRWFPKQNSDNLGCTQRTIHRVLRYSAFEKGSKQSIFKKPPDRQQIPNVKKYLIVSNYGSKRVEEAPKE